MNLLELAEKFGGYRESQKMQREYSRRFMEAFDSSDEVTIFFEGEPYSLNRATVVAGYDEQHRQIEMDFPGLLDRLGLRKFWSSESNSFPQLPDECYDVINREAGYGRLNERGRQIISNLLVKKVRFSQYREDMYDGPQKIREDVYFPSS
ncbi:hypothetical protein HY449_03405 [Candidatus Pacearchaeota archaeon]|nr:hypothetical protein [Candidatus Pacearchaeota archaeon]